MTTDRAALRTRLIAMRADLFDQIEHHISAGDLALLAGVEAAIAAIAAIDDADGMPDAKPGNRVVLSDDNRIIMLTTYADGAPACATLSPVRALDLAGELLRAARRRLR